MTRSNFGTGSTGRTGISWRCLRQGSSRARTGPDHIRTVRRCCTPSINWCWSASARRGKAHSECAIKESIVALPSIVIVGRPNVGKSTLFNAILGTRRSIVGDEPGITRDRIHGEAIHRGRKFELIDTGGIIPNDAELIPSQILKQAHVALERAAHVIFLIDGRAEVTSADRELAAMLRRLGKPVALAVNK